MTQLTPQLLASVAVAIGHDVNPVNGSIALTWNPSGQPRTYLLPQAGGEPRPLVADKSQFPSWAHDGTRLVYLQDLGGSEAADVMLLDTESGQPRNLTEDEHVYTWPRFAPDGRLAVVSNRDGDFDPYLLDTETGTATRLAEGGRAASSLAWSPDARYLGLIRMGEADEQGNMQSTLHLIDTRRGEGRDLGPLGGDQWHSDWSWRATPDGLFLCVPSDVGEYQELLLVSLDGERETLPLSTVGDKMQPQWSPDGTRLLYIHETQSDRRLRLWDARDGSDHDLSVADGVHHEPRWALDGESLTVLFQCATRPPELWRVTPGGEAERLTNALTGDFPSEALTPNERVSFRTWDDLEINALLYTPRDANGAAVIYVHGGPTASFRNGWDTDVQLLASWGYTVLAPNVRGSTGFGKTFRDLNRHDWGGGDLRDLEAANDFLRQRGFERIGVMGGSYGGYLTLMALTKQPKLWTAGAALFPIANLVTLYESSRPADLRPYLTDQIGTPEERPDFFEDRSPANFVEQVEAPLLLLQGENDIRTPLSEAQEMGRRLAAAGKEHELHIYPNEGHGFQLRENRENSLQRVLDWFNRYLKNHAEVKDD